jgi:hypothetical protein
MAFNRNLWKKIRFKDTGTPPWPCPRCEGPIAVYDKRIRMTASNDLPQNILNLDSELIPDIGFLENRFSGILHCTSCDLKITISGYGHHLDRYGNTVQNQYHEKIEEAYYPINFDPPLRIITILRSYPKEIVKQLNNSFYHYWNDSSACANKIRIVVELVLDIQGISAGRLHQRINEYKSKKNNVIGEILESVKWIGNAGSHVGGISRKDLLDGYELLDHALTNMFPDKTNLPKLIELSDRINRTKGPLSKEQSSD